MTRWIRTALLMTAVALGVLVPAGSALAAGPAASPGSGQLTFQVPGS